MWNLYHQNCAGARAKLASVKVSEVSDVSKMASEAGFGGVGSFGCSGRGKPLARGAADGGEQAPKRSKFAKPAKRVPRWNLPPVIQCGNMRSRFAIDLEGRAAQFCCGT